MLRSRIWGFRLGVPIGLFFLSIFVAGCFPENSERESSLSALARWEDQRLAPQDSLTAMLRHEDAHVRLAAVKTAGLIGRSDVLPEMLANLQDQSGTVVRQAAFSLGLLGDPAAVEALVRTARDPHAATRVAALRGLAHLDHDGQAFLDAAISPDHDEAAAAWDGLRNLVSSVDSTALSETLLAGLARQETDILWRVLRCCERVARPELLPTVAPHAASVQPQVRVHALRALSRFDSPEALAAVITGNREDNPFRDRHADRVEVALLRSVGSLAHHNFSLPEDSPREGRDFLITTLITGAGHANPHVAVTALTAMQNTVDALPLPPEAALQESLLPVWRIRLARAAQNHLDHPVKDVRAAAVRARALLRGQGAAPQVESILMQTDEPIIQVACLHSISRVDSQAWSTLESYTRTDGDYSPSVQAAALEGLVQALQDGPAGKASPQHEESVIDHLTAAAAHPDFVVAATAADLLGQFPTRLSLIALRNLWHTAAGPEASDLKLGVLGAIDEMGGQVLALAQPDSSTKADPLVEGVRQLLRESFDAADIRIRLAGKAAAEKTKLLPNQLIPTRGSLVATLPAHERNGQQADLTRAFAAGKVLCRTDKGDIVITLDGKSAPNTCANFIDLIGRGYFDDLNFHRVVPDFVVQGGCPRGDGWGGPGFTIRSEWSRLVYQRGAVGIAHSGKDTGGSQFFFTLSEQPHLNGRYTVFGEVSEGMEIVDQLTVGDTFKLEIIP